MHSNNHDGHEAHSHSHAHVEDLFRQPKTKNLRSGKVTLLPGEDVGEHIPFKREEIVVVLSGEGTVEIEGKQQQVHQGDVVFIAENQKHNVINNSSEKMVYVYVVSIFE